MKRITFKTEHEEPVKNGTKRFTSRFKDQNWRVGERRAAVAPRDGKPAFLTPVKDAFCILECVSVESKQFGYFTEQDAADCGVTRDWYIKANPSVTEWTFIHKYGFKVVQP